MPIITPTTRTTASSTSLLSTITLTSSSITAIPSTGSSGLSKSGTVAIAVVVPIAVLTLLAILAFFFWRRSRDKKARLAARKGEIEDYGFDPNAPDGGGGGPGPSSAAGLGAGALAGAGAAGVASEMRQTSYEEDDGGYRGWGPTSSSTSKRPGWVPAGAEVGAPAGVGALAGAGLGSAYYNHQRGNDPNPYDYPNQTGDQYYYPEEADHQVAPPNIPAKSYDRYDPTLGGGYGAPSTDYQHQQQEPAPLGVVNTDVQRHPSNTSSHYSTVSTDENAGRSYQNSPRFPQTQAVQNTTALPSGRPGRSTMGAGAGEYEDEDEVEHGVRYDAVNF